MGFWPGIGFLNLIRREPYVLIHKLSLLKNMDFSYAALMHFTCFLQIQWLINNYEPADGTSLPRCTLYSHYIK